MRSLSVLTVAATLLAASTLHATTARASRPASQEEAAAIVAAMDTTTDCVLVTISTVDENYAIAETADAPLFVPCPPPNAHELLTRMQDGTWQAKGAVDDADSPCRRLGVPDGAGMDLNICEATVAPWRTTVTCWKDAVKDGSRYRSPRRVVRHPRSCLTLSPGKSLAETTDMRRLRWRDWGQPVAKAHGYLRALHGEYRPNGKLYFPEYKATLRASAPDEYRGKRWYTRLRISTRYGTFVLEMKDPWASEYW